MDVNLNVKNHIDSAVVHWHDETAVPMTPVAAAEDQTTRIGQSRTVFNHQGDFECPQCHTRVGTGITSTTDIEVEGDANVRYS